MSASPARSVLVVDDDEPLRQRLARALSARGFDVRSAPGGEEALALARVDSPEYA
ncbi:MAG: response regulator, partial [Myxococcales bacterium]